MVQLPCFFPDAIILLLNVLDAVLISHDLLRASQRPCSFPRVFLLRKFPEKFRLGIMKFSAFGRGMFDLRQDTPHEVVVDGLLVMQALR